MELPLAQSKRTTTQTLNTNAPTPRSSIAKLSKPADPGPSNLQQPKKRFWRRAGIPAVPALHGTVTADCRTTDSTTAQDFPFCTHDDLTRSSQPQACVESDITRFLRKQRAVRCIQVSLEAHRRWCFCKNLSCTSRKLTR